jgi:ubiquinone/menaquinone biosynthesis C-methylase UbiE
MSDQGFTPAAGHHALTPLYDLGIALLTREGRWRSALVEQIAPGGNDRIVDVGCGTGSLLLRLAEAAPDARLIGIDPDPAILARARTRLSAAARAEVNLHQGFARDVAALMAGQPATKIVSSLVFHQVPLAEKRAALAAMFQALGGGGELHIADYGLQRTPLMRFLFRATIQNLDGRTDTEPNARGILPDLIAEAGFRDVEETKVVPTPSGSISLYRAVR